MNYVKITIAALLAINIAILFNSLWEINPNALFYLGLIAFGISLYKFKNR